MQVVMGLSGGMDSATLLGILLEQGYTVHCCVFYYGSKHNKYENQAARNLIAFYQEKYLVYEHLLDISKIMESFESDLLLSGGSIPEGHYAGENMKKTVVPSRNLIFTSIMAGIAESIGAEKVALGVHSGDHFIYPDCRTEFVKALDNTVYLSSDKKVEVIAPLAGDDKYSILQKGYNLNTPVPYELTRTCYKDQAASCGKCGSCNERLEAFEKLGKHDPIPYELNYSKYL